MVRGHLPSNVSICVRRKPSTNALLVLSVELTHQRAENLVDFDDGLWGHSRVHGSVFHGHALCDAVHELQNSETGIWNWWSIDPSNSDRAVRAWVLLRHRQIPSMPRRLIPRSHFIVCPQLGHSGAVLRTRPSPYANSSAASSVSTFLARSNTSI